ncbi:hypothetical protein C5167_018256 [Papaver somniferum]|uniref:Uncharacterized protein n=1 Tax=Papaver somniferum TaxID=3469 RepID=A0A4Y7INY7_PAPSO|nr:hypothetical protein C5167_018256 [Papaver somniferum]
MAVVTGWQCSVVCQLVRIRQVQSIGHSAAITVSNHQRGGNAQWSFSWYGLDKCRFVVVMIPFSLHIMRIFLLVRAKKSKLEVLGCEPETRKKIVLFIRADLDRVKSSLGFQKRHKTGMGGIIKSY